MSNASANTYDLTSAPSPQKINRDSVIGVSRHLESLSEEFIINCERAQRELFEIPWEPKNFPWGHKRIYAQYYDKAKNKLVFQCRHNDVHAVLSSCADRKIRERFFKMYQSRGHAAAPPTGLKPTAAPHDNVLVAKKLLSTRKYLAGLLGYENYLEYALRHKMIKSPAVLNNFLQDTLKTLAPIHRKNHKKLARFACQKLGIEKLAPWDINFIISKFCEDILQTKSWEFLDYFELGAVKKFSFDYFEKMFAVKFISCPGNADKEAYIIHDLRQNKKLARLNLDLCHDPERTKFVSSVAAAVGVYKSPKDSSLVELDLNANFTKDPVHNKYLLDLKDLALFFHEIGHALETSFTYANFGETRGIETEIDMLEFYSHFMENFVYDEDFLHAMSAHHLTGEKLPRTVFNNSVKVQNFLNSFNLMDSLLLAHKELKINLLEQREQLPENIQAATYEIFGECSGLNSNIFYERNPEMFHSTARLVNNCNMYSYLLSEALASAVFSKFKGRRSLAVPPSATAMRDNFFEVRGVVPFAESYENFTGQKITALSAANNFKVGPQNDSFWKRVFTR